MIIGVDLDDVLAESFSSMDDFHNEKYGTSLKKEDHFTFDLTKVWKATKEECRKRMTEFNHSKHNENIKPIIAAQKGLQILTKKHRVVVITSRMESFRHKTEEWLQKHYGDHNLDVHHANHYYGLNEHKKSHICQKLGVDVLIDDCLEYAEECGDENISVLLLDNPWNQTENLPKNVTRVKDWEDILEKIKDMEKIEK